MANPDPSRRTDEDASPSAAAGCATGSQKLRAYQMGYAAHMQGLKVGQNPYRDENSEVHWNWMAGWTKAGLDRNN